MAPRVEAASPVQGQSVASLLGRGRPLTIEIVLLSHIFDSSSGWKSVNRFLDESAATCLHHITFVWLVCAAQITQH